MTQHTSRDAWQTLKRNGKSFWFAGMFLPRATAHAAARLYVFCRTMDDLADDSADAGVSPESQRLLATVRDDLRRGASSDPQVADFLALARQYQLPLEAADHLIRTFLEDAATRLHIEDEPQLVCYCYGVAGTVGLLMAPLLGAAGPEARRAAIHLGIAMQMTNIARDVLEDAQNGRRYLPGAWVHGLSAQQIASSLNQRETVAAAVARLLDLAERYYAGAALGFALLPARTRRGIKIAAAVYREIGCTLRRKHLAWWQGRVSVSWRRKLWLASRISLGWSPFSAAHRAEGDAEQLSVPLAGLPGVP